MLIAVLVGGRLERQDDIQAAYVAAEARVGRGGGRVVDVLPRLAARGHQIGVVVGPEHAVPATTVDDLDDGAFGELVGASPAKSALAVVLEAGDPDHAGAPVHRAPDELEAAGLDAMLLGVGHRGVEEDRERGLLHSFGFWVEPRKKQKNIRQTNQTTWRLVEVTTLWTPAALSRLLSTTSLLPTQTNEIAMVGFIEHRQKVGAVFWQNG